MTNKNPILLGVNIDHVATLRQVRLTNYPEPAEAVLSAEKGGADGITVHLREDRRHIQEFDIKRIQGVLQTRLNLEMAVTEAMLVYALQVLPEHCCLVPEKREELTTEGGLDVCANAAKIRTATQRLNEAGIEVSLFIDPEIAQIEATLACGAPVIEIHTGCYANAKSPAEREIELARIQKAAHFAHQAGLIVNAGHGLYYDNVQPIASLPEINELNIGHGIIARALFVGLEEAVRQMKALMLEARR